MGLLARFTNLWRGMWGQALHEAETHRPEAVYQAAIDARVDQYQKLMKAVSGIVYLRNKLEQDLTARTRELTELAPQIVVAVQSGEDQAALVLLERRNALTREIEDTKTELERVSNQAEEAKSSLISFQGEIEKLKSERDAMLAKREHARARLKIQEQISGLSTDADLQALDAVRESIHKLAAQADVAAELNGAGMGQKLKQIKEQTGSAIARAELDEIKRQLADQPRLASPSEIEKRP